GQRPAGQQIGGLAVERRQHDRHRRAPEPGRLDGDAWKGCEIGGDSVPERLHRSSLAHPSPTRTFRVGLWLPFLNTYRTVCMAPSSNLRSVLEGMQGLGLAA